MNRSIKWLNELSAPEATAELLKCCGSTRWASMMCAARPFSSVAAVLAYNDQAWRSTQEEDWLEAFQAHPKIGEKKAATAQSQEAQRWSSEEQSGVAAAQRETVAALAEKNRAYENRFGFIYIVCATGKSSEELLTILSQRLQNDRETEMKIAAEEQRMITTLRLRKLLSA